MFTPKFSRSEKGWSRGIELEKMVAAVANFFSPKYYPMLGMTPKNLANVLQ